MRRKSWAILNSTGACSDAATVCPGSTARVRITPSMGEMICIFERSAAMILSEALVAKASASATDNMALARAKAASAASISWVDETPRARSVANLLRCCWRSSRVMTASRSLASAPSNCAALRSRSAVMRMGSRMASTWPRFTLSFSSTRTSRTTPDISLPMSTCVSGWMVPVAETVMTRSVFWTAAVS